MILHGFLFPFQSFFLYFNFLQLLNLDRSYDAWYHQDCRDRDDVMGWCIRHLLVWEREIAVSCWQCLFEVGVCHFFPALPARGDVRHGCLRVFKHTLDSFFFFSVGSHSHCNYCWSGFKTKPAKAEWRQHTPTMPSYVVLWACDSHEWRTKNFAFTWMNHSLPTETGHSETSTDYCWTDISLLLSYISLQYCPQMNICQQMDTLPVIWCSWEMMSTGMCRL